MLGLDCPVVDEIAGIGMIRRTPRRRNLVPSVSRSRRLRAAAKILAASCVAEPSECAQVRSLKSAALSFSVTVEPAHP
jgi:hypothetical protein